MLHEILSQRYKMETETKQSPGGLQLFCVEFPMLAFDTKDATNKSAARLLAVCQALSWAALTTTCQTSLETKKSREVSVIGMR